MSVLKLLCLVFLSTTLAALHAQPFSAHELAGLLADRTNRKEAIARIISASSRWTPVLLSWTKNPPPTADRHELFVGLADAFGQLRTIEAIPFLVENIGIQRRNRPNLWLKTIDVLMEGLPAAGALVRIGPEASKAIVDRYPTLPADERLVALFAVANIGDPRARSFLAAELGRATLERRWAQEGLRRLDDQK
ncbi:MAG: hypothetical protein R2729_29330 [Bryobacteraceae bacterium]